MQKNDFNGIAVFIPTKNDLFEHEQLFPIVSMSSGFGSD